MSDGPRLPRAWKSGIYDKYAERRGGLEGATVQSESLLTSSERATVNPENHPEWEQAEERLFQRACSPGVMEMQRWQNALLSMQAEAIILRPVKRMSLWDRLRVRARRWFR